MLRRRGIRPLIVIALLAFLLAPVVVTQARTLMATTKWQAEFFPNQNLQGNPVHTETVDQLDYDWGDLAPAGNLPNDHFSARFTKVAQFSAGNYVFGVLSDDGARVYVDGQLLIDNWREGAHGWLINDRYMTTGEHTITVEYFEYRTAAFIEFQFYRYEDGGPFWRAEYFPNPNLIRPPGAVGYEDVLTLDWGGAPPLPGWPADNWSARWTQKREFSDAEYIFAARADDGVRVYFDGQLIIDRWGNGQYDWVEARVRPSAGLHTVVVEFFDAAGSARLQAGYYPTSALATTTAVPSNTPTLTGTQPTATNTLLPTRTPLPIQSTNTPRPAATNTRRPPTATNTPVSTATRSFVAGTPILTPATSTPLPAIADLDNGTVVSETDTKRFVWSGFPGLAMGPGGYNNSYSYVNNRQNKLTTTARWYFTPEQGGYYDVFVFIPETIRPATESAAYTIYASQRTSPPVTLDQQANKGQWASLGSYYFGDFGGQYIELDNVTGETANTTEVLYDAALFVFSP